MKQFSPTVALASALAILAASPLVLPQVEHTNTSPFEQSEGAHHGLSGLTCVSEKLFFPKPPPPPPDKPKATVVHLQTVLASYGE